jgi:acyl homoserine lactone synthase
MNVSCIHARHVSKQLYSDLARYRYQIFVELLGWKLGSTNGLEIDQFDHEDSTYVIAQNANEEIIGCGRLLPTTQDYLLERVFPELLNGSPPPKDENVWELSRFAALDLETQKHVKGGPQEFLSERVLLQILKFGVEKSITHLVAFSTLPVERLIKRAGVDMHRFGPPLTIRGERLIAFVIAVNDQSIDALTRFENIALQNGSRGSKPHPTLHSSAASRGS